ncbi:hypothetical protein KIL84_015875 [Mauremys mutica]|uniref:Uncharacterized protein n=1 Tax=Mauremys mutica TaxID=74926 RepID=A0A9D3WSU5_9SAUR|nr:hypothetical protein KIL84_015875 [Mauremys mutica]
MGLGWLRQAWGGTSSQPAWDPGAIQAVALCVSGAREQLGPAPNPALGLAHGGGRVHAFGHPPSSREPSAHLGQARPRPHPARAPLKAKPHGQGRGRRCRGAAHATLEASLVGLTHVPGDRGHGQWSRPHSCHQGSGWGTCQRRGPCGALWAPFPACTSSRMDPVPCPVCP